jgi:excinuclease UvrABC nuclease subunit
MSKKAILKEQHPALSINLVDVLRAIDPSDTGKYMHFLIRNLYVATGGKEQMHELMGKFLISTLKKANVDKLKQFEEYSREQLIHEDISKIEDWSALTKHVDAAFLIKREKELEREVQKWYEDDEWLMVTPYSFEASKTYGRGTRWCTTSQNHFGSYTNGVLIYIINKLRSKDAKWAIYMQGNTWAVYDEMDTRIFDSCVLPLSEKVRAVITNIYQTFNGKSTEWVRHYHSPEYVYHNSRWKEIAKLKPSVAQEIIQMYENQKVLDNKLNQARLECLRVVATQEEPPKKEKAPRKAPASSKPHYKLPGDSYYWASPIMPHYGGMVDDEDDEDDGEF